MQTQNIVCENMIFPRYSMMLFSDVTLKRVKGNRGA